MNRPSASIIEMDTGVEVKEGLSSFGLSTEDINDIIDDKIEDNKSKQGKPCVDIEFNS